MKTCDKMKYLDNRKQILWESLPAKNMQVGLWNPRNLICRKVFLSHPPTAPFFFSLNIKFRKILQWNGSVGKRTCYASTGARVQIPRIHAKSCALGVDMLQQGKKEERNREGHSTSSSGLHVSKCLYLCTHMHAAHTHKHTTYIYTTYNTHTYTAYICHILHTHIYKHTTF